MLRIPSTLSIFFFNDTATTEIYTLSLHDALPISASNRVSPAKASRRMRMLHHSPTRSRLRSEEHTSELQSHVNLVCRLLLEKKKHEAVTISAWRKQAKSTVLATASRPLGNTRIHC